MWGLDFVDDTTGFAVGVDALYVTHDGGDSWTTVGEPPGSHLIRVAFVNPQAGFGLGTAGTVFDTSDGGRTWNPTSLAMAGTSLCEEPSGVFVAGADGQVEASSDGGATWTPSQDAQVELSSGPSWADLTCDGAGAVWSVTRQLRTTGHRAAAEYVVDRSATGLSPWAPVADSQNGAVLAIPPSLPLTDIAVIASAPDGAAVVGYDGESAALQVMNANAAGNFGTQGFITPETDPQLSDRDAMAPAYLRVQGVSLIDGLAWLLVTNSGVSASDPSQYATEVFASSDGGRTWTPKYRGPSQTQPADH